MGKYLDGNGLKKVVKGLKNYVEDKINEVPTSDLQPVCFIIDQRQTVTTDSDDMVSGNYIKDVDGKLKLISNSGAEGFAYNNTLAYIRKNSHAYVGKYSADKGMQLKQLDPTTRTKFADGTSAIPYISNDNGEYDVWAKINVDVYYKTEAYTPEGATKPNDDYVLVTIATEIPKGDNPDTWQKWDKNTLVGVYKAYVKNNKMYSISGKKASNWITQINSKAYARARGEGFRLVTYAFHKLAAILFYGYYSSLDSQKVLGYGTANLVSNAYYPKVTGLTNDLAETDTNSVTGNGASSPNMDQVYAGIGSDIKSVNFWNIENIHGDVYEWMDDLIVMQAKRPSTVETANALIYLSDYCAANGYPKITKFGKDYQLTAELLSAMNENQRFIAILDINGNITRIVQFGDYTANSEGWIKKMCFGEHADLIVKEWGGSNNTRYSDYGYVYSAGCVALRSAHSSYSAGGVGYLHLYDGAGFSHSVVGSRLQYEGTSETIHFVNNFD